MFTWKIKNGRTMCAPTKFCFIFLYKLYGIICVLHDFLVLLKILYILFVHKDFDVIFLMLIFCLRYITHFFLMFLHLREKTKFIRYDRYDRFIFAISGKNARRPPFVCASTAFPAPSLFFLFFPISFIFTVYPFSWLASRPSIQQILPIVLIFLKERGGVGR